MDRGQSLDTPLHAAARQSSVEVVHLLADYGAPLKCRNAEGKSALDLAAPKSGVEQALLLREGNEGLGVQFSPGSASAVSPPCLISGLPYLLSLFPWEWHVGGSRRRWRHRDGIR